MTTPNSKRMIGRRVEFRGGRISFNQSASTAMSVITVNGKKFAKTAKDFASSHTDSSGPCIGFYRKRGNGVLLMDEQQNPVAFVVNNRHGEQFFVTASNDADGRTWFMFSTTHATEEFLGLTGLSYSQKSGAAEAAIEQVQVAAAKQPVEVVLPRETNFNQSIEGMGDGPSPGV